MKFNARVIALLLTLVLVVAAVTGCKSRGEDKPTKPTDDKPATNETVEVEEGEGTIADILPNFVDAVEDKEELNPETVGWLQIPNTTISDVVVQSKKDNNYYLRLNFDLDYEFSGVYYADYRCDFGDGTRENLPINTTIYGHALTDDPAAEKYDVKFAPLHKFRDTEFASDNLYMFFSTGKENFAYEIISVFVANSDNVDNPYNKGNAEKGTFHDIVRDEVIPRSLYDYGVKVTDDDKFLTLSTCIYVLEDGTPTYYPNTYYRYAIMGRLVEDDAPFIEHKDLTVDEDRIIDKDGKMSS